MQGLLAKAFALAEHDGADQGGGRRVDVDDGAAGKVKGVAGEPAATPYPVANREVDQGNPQNCEGQEGGELHALGKGAGDQRRGDDGEHQLKGAEQQVGDGGGAGGGVEADTGQAGKIQVADKAADIGAEGQRVAVKHPDDRDDAQADEALHDGAQNVLGADQTAIEQGQARGHQHDQGRSDEHEGNVTCIHSHSPCLQDSG